MTDAQKAEMRAWAKARRAEGKSIGLVELVGHKVSREWAGKMIRSGVVLRERCPGFGLFAYWWAETPNNQQKGKQ